MNKKPLLLVILFLAVIIFFSISQRKQINNLPTSEQEISHFDGKNSSFTIDGKLITLISGISRTSITPGSVSETITRYFGNETTGDLNNDGKDDYAFLVNQETGGSGVFYYVVVAIKTDNGYKTTNAFFVGDRIAPQSTYIPKGSQELQVNYAQRRAGEPMTASPSEGATLLLKVTKDGVLEGLMK